MARSAVPFVVAALVVLIVGGSAWVWADNRHTQQTDSHRVSALENTGATSPANPDTNTVIGSTFTPNTDIALKVQRALDACPQFGCDVRIPAGSFFITRTININRPVHIAGAGKEATLLTYIPQAGAAFRTLVSSARNAVGFSNLRLKATHSVSATAFDMAYVEPATFSNVWIQDFAGGIRLTGNGKDDQSVGSWITDVRIDDVSGNGSFAISMDHVADVYITALQMYTRIDDITSTDLIIDRGAQGIYINSSITIGGKHNLVVRDTKLGGDYGILPSAIHCDSTYFDSATGGAAVVFDSSLLVDPVRAMFSNCWAGGAGFTQAGSIATADAPGIEILGGSDIQWSGGVVRQNCGSGIVIDGSLPVDLLQVSNTRIIGNNAGNAPDGVGIAIRNPNARDVSIMGATIGNLVDQRGHQKYGISIPKSDANVTIGTNIINSNELGPIKYT